MAAQHWGEFIDSEKINEEEKLISVGAKKIKLEEVQNVAPSKENINVCIIKVKNSLVTQTIEVMKQTEMLQSLIDTYSNKSGTSNYLLNPCQIIPEVDFPPENAANFINNEKFAKPIWFIPPLKTNLSRILPKKYLQINTHICRASLRKAVCGQLRVAGFTDTTESALVLFADAVEEFIRDLLMHVREVHKNDAQLETRNEIKIKTLEKAFYATTNTSLTQIHNYFKHNIAARNRTEINEFNEALQEYDKLMKESQNMQKEEFQDRGYHNIMEMPQSNDPISASGNLHEIGMANQTNMADSQPHMSGLM